MSRILSIETSTKSCSVALAENGVVVDSNSITLAEYSHAEQLHPMISQLAGIQTNPPHAVAVSMGPGSFTGLRIGIAAAKGLCFAWNVPLISVDTLTLMYEMARAKYVDADLYIPMIDARRMEVYMRIFDTTSNDISPVEARIIEEDFFVGLRNKSLVIFGDGAGKFSSMLNGTHHYLEGIYPDACMMALVAEEKMKLGKKENLAYFEPYYLKDFLPGPLRTRV
jgi:tRNA threonylcarbamoyladenosine biosynthesis protein TsaB